MTQPDRALFRIKQTPNNTPSEPAVTTFHPTLSASIKPFCTTSSVMNCNYFDISCRQAAQNRTILSRRCMGWHLTQNPRRVLSFVRIYEAISTLSIHCISCKRWTSCVGVLWKSSRDDFIFCTYQLKSFSVIYFEVLYVIFWSDVLACNCTCKSEL